MKRYKIKKTVDGLGNVEYLLYKRVFLFFWLRQVPYGVFRKYEHVIDHIEVEEKLKNVKIEVITYL